MPTKLATAFCIMYRFNPTKKCLGMMVIRSIQKYRGTPPPIVHKKPPPLPARQLPHDPLPRPLPAQERPLFLYKNAFCGPVPAPLVILVYTERLRTKRSCNGV